MIQLVYVSTAAPSISPADVAAIEQIAIRENAKSAITGFLLFNGRHFMQVLEGAQDAVLAVFANIAKDQRHRGVVQILNEPISKRAFPDWSMQARTIANAGSDASKLVQGNKALERAAERGVSRAARDAAEL